MKAVKSVTVLLFKKATAENKRDLKIKHEPFS
jgi:hypothetical protein